MRQFEWRDAEHISSGTATLLDAGSNGASGIRWGRWSGGTASANTAGGIQQLNLANSSLHWIVGPNFEFMPVLPVAGVDELHARGRHESHGRRRRMSAFSAAPFWRRISLRRQ